MKEKFFIKGFDKDLKCRGYQFEIGKEYKINLPKGYKLTEKDLCSDKVFHFCDELTKVHQFYECFDEANNRFCIIEVLGQFCKSGNKCGSNHIKIIRELTGEELETAKGLINGNTGLFNSGYYNSGYYNSGYHNSGNCNSGFSNSGYYNKGSYNSGIFNKTEGSNGVFCNKEPKICIFNIQTDFTWSDFINSKYYKAIISSKFPLIEWRPKRGKSNIKLKANTYEQACNLWWKKMTKENKQIIKEMPNFDIDIFCDITGIPKEKVI